MVRQARREGEEVKEGILAEEMGSREKYLVKGELGEYGAVAGYCCVTKVFSNPHHFYFVHGIWNGEME